MEKEYRSCYFKGSFKTRAEPEGKFIEGYFAVFNQRTELWPGTFEEIAPEAFANSLKNNDIRVLFNHNTDIVLGRMGSGTATLRTDAHGLFGSVRVNEDDKQALDIYARVQRGDIDGCSFGFYPLKEERSDLSDGAQLYRVLEADTSEVSVCTFPAYPQTDVQARKKDFERRRGESRENKLKNLKKRLGDLKC